MKGGTGAAHPVVLDPTTSLFLTLPAAVTEVDSGPDVGVTFPTGFAAAGVPAGIKESGRPDVGVVAVDPE